MSIIDMNKEIFNEKINDGQKPVLLNSGRLVRLLQKNSSRLARTCKAV